MFLAGQIGEVFRPARLRLMLAELAGTG